MNVRLSYNVDFSTAVFDGARLFPSKYHAKINIITMTADSKQQNIAIQRILFFVHQIFDNSVFIYKNHENIKKVHKLAKDSRVIVFPEEPVDQIVGMILFHKLNAITEGRFEIESLIISSDSGFDISYTIDEFEDFNSVIELPWWDRPDPSTVDFPKKSKFNNTWKDVQLEWDNNKLFQTDVDFVVELEDNIKSPQVVVIEGGEVAEENE